MLGIWCGKRPRQKNLDIWKDRTLFDVTEESNLRIIVSPHQNRKKETQREFGKHNERKNMLNNFSKGLLHCLMCKVKKLFLSGGRPNPPNVGDKTNGKGL